MSFRRLSFVSLTAMLTLALAGCGSFPKKPKKPKLVQPKGTLTDQNGDTSFQGFVSRLRKAASRHDVEMLSSMMSANFGYSWAPGGEGPGVFQYWDKNNLWPELEGVLQEKFVPSGDFMVAPAQVTFDPDYQGYRAGLRQVNGSWRFAYFVSAPPAEKPAAPAPAAQQ